MNYWLMKSEPLTFSIDKLLKDGETIWDGVRNYQARNYLKQMVLGDIAFFYHSNCEVPAIVGTMTVLETLLPDPSQFNKRSKYYDPKSNTDMPRWHTVRVAFRQKFSRIVPLSELREKFPDLIVAQRGSRLSVTPVDAHLAQKILEAI